MTNLLGKVTRTVKHWWLFVILGILMIIGGIWVFRTPLESYVGLSIIFSIMVFVSGTFDVAFSLSNRDILKDWGWHLTGGILKVLLGIVLVIYPGISIVALPMILGFWLMFGAVSIMSGALNLKHYHISGWGWLLLLGILLMIFSFMVLADPILGGETIVIMTGIAIVLYGVSYALFGMKLKKVKDVVSNIGKAVLGDFDKLKKDVLSTIQKASDTQASSDEVGKKLDSFKDLLSE